MFDKPLCWWQEILCYIWRKYQNWTLTIFFLATFKSSSLSPKKEAETLVDLYYYIIKLHNVIEIFDV